MPLEWKGISNLLVYNDFGFMDEKIDDFDDSFMNVTGVLLTPGNVYMYVDTAQGKDQFWEMPYQREPLMLIGKYASI